MDTAANSNEVRLRKGESFNERLIIAGFGLAICFFAIPDFGSASLSGRLPIGGIAALLVGCLLMAGAAFKRNIVWIITPDGILIGKQSPFGRLRSQMIRTGEISQMHLRKDDGARAEFHLAFNTVSGDTLTSPPLPDVTQVHDTTVRVARMLALPEPVLPDNPLDAVNTEIRLGEPVEPKRGMGHRGLVVLFAGLFSFPFVHAWWNGALSALGVAIWTLGLVVAAAFFRYAPRMSGSHWMIGDRAIRIERLSLQCEPETETVDGSGIKAIDVQSDGEDGHHAIIIRLRDDRKIRSPKLADRNQAEALRGEIMRRLNIPADIEKAR